MILIIDDRKNLAEAYLEDINTITGSIVEYRHPNEALAFVREHCWAIEWILVDEVFDRLEVTEFRGGTELGSIIHKEFKFIPLVLYTANDTKFSRSDEAHVVGFIKTFEKGDLSRSTTRELNNGEIITINEIESLRENIEKLYDLETFKDKQEKRHLMRKDFIKKTFAEISEAELNSLKLAMVMSQSKQYTIQVAGKKTSIKEFLSGWANSDSMSDEEITHLIESEGLLPDAFMFKDINWKKEFGLYQSGNYEQACMELDYRAFNILFDIYSRKDEDSYQLTPTNKIKYASYSFTKKISHAAVFRDKMIARRVLIAYNHIAPHLSLAQVVALLTRGNTNTTVTRYKDANNPKQDLQAYPVLNKNLELKVSSKIIQVDNSTVLREEMKWYNFIVTLDSVTALSDMMREHFKNHSADLKGMKDLISLNPPVNKKKLIDCCAMENCRQLIPFIEYITKKIEE
jgi:hypothetical protein